MLRLGSNAQRLIIHYCQSNQEAEGKISNHIVSSKIVDISTTGHMATYDDINNPINRIIIEASGSISNDSPLYIGRDSTDTLSSPLAVDIDEVKIFNKALSSGEIYEVSANTILPDMIAGWSLDRTTLDLTGKHHGSMLSPLEWTSGFYSFAASFANQGSIEVPHHSDLALGEKSFSISFWIRTMTKDQKPFVIVHKMKTTDIGIFGYSLAIDKNKILFDLAHIDLKPFEFEFVPVKDWTHIVLTVNREADQVSMFVNAALVKNSIISGSVPANQTCTLFEVCYTDYEDAFAYEGQKGFIDIHSEIIEMTNGLTKRLQPIWRPDTTFAIQIETKDHVSHLPDPKNEAGRVRTEHPSSFHVFAFRTEGVLGHFHKHDPLYNELETAGNASQYKHSGLKHYIDYEKSYPNADGNIINAKPLFFRKTELLLFFRYAYIHSMFSDWESYHGLTKITSRLEANLLDEAGQIISQTPDFTFEVTEGNPDMDIVKLNKMITFGKDCTSAKEIKPFDMRMNYKMPDLKPGKLYTAVFNSVYGSFPSSEVHKYTFQTSMYGSFTEQVESYILQDNKPIVHNLIADIPDEELWKAAKIFNNPMSTIEDNNATDEEKLLLLQCKELVSSYADPYDRLLNGVLRMPSMEVPVCTEFNLVLTISEGNTRILGILIRNPEPFNDPKIPTDKKQQTIEALDNQGNKLSVLVAKEPSRIFISNEEMNLTSEEVNLTFNYFQFNGSEYTLYGDLPSPQVKISITHN